MDNNELGTNLAEVGTDCISRQQAIDALRDYLVGKNVPCDGTLTCRLIENEVINKLPSAEPKRIRGKWIEYEQEFMLEGSLETVQKTVKECSVCTTKIAGMVGIMNFCPNCGADTRGEQDE